MRPVVSSGAPRSTEPRTRREHGEGLGGRAQRTSADHPARSLRDGGAERAGRTARGGTPGLKVRRLVRGTDDGFHSPLVQGLKSSEDAQRLAAEIAFAATRLLALSEQPPGLWAEVADTGGELEERTWLAFQIAYIGPDEDEQPFATIAAARVSWAEFVAGGAPRLDGLAGGSRGSLDSERAGATFEAYRGWVQRAGSQQEAFSGEASWTPERRFERCFERLAALGGLSRDTCFELLDGLGATGAYPLAAGKLQIGGENELTWAAKRCFGIGDTLLLERRAATLAQETGVELGALDLGLANWGAGTRYHVGVEVELEPEPALLSSLQDVLGL